VNTASLELDSLPLHQTIQQWGEEVLAFGIKELRILPLFLLPGVHVQEDIPREVRLAQQALGGKIRLELSPYLGSNPNLRQLLAGQFSHFPTEGRILLSHGSRRRSGNQPIEAIATHFKALPAYWSVSPSLREQVELLIKQGNLSVAIVPYFLFAGGITEAITQQVQQLRSDFPQIRFLLGEPLGATSELAKLIINYGKKN
jgi:sirohydrochlorin ferrochelatase